MYQPISVGLNQTMQESEFREGFCKEAHLLNILHTAFPGIH